MSPKVNAAFTYDVSASNNGSVMSYLVENESSKGTYTMYLQGDGKVYANSNSSHMFRDFTNLVSIEGLENLDTSKVTNMEWMLAGCTSLTTLDVSSFNTSNVTNMSYMFYNCSSLTTLDVSNFDTSQVTDMRAMFYDMSNIVEIKFGNKFNTLNTTSLWDMFSQDTKLKNLDLSSFYTNNTTLFVGMFYNCSSLKSLDISNFDVSKAESIDNIFYNMPNDALVYVKDASVQQWVLNHPSCPSGWTESNVIVKQEN